MFLNEIASKHVVLADGAKRHLLGIISRQY